MAPESKKKSSGGGGGGVFGKILTSLGLRKKRAEPEVFMADKSMARDIYDDNDDDLMQNDCMEYESFNVRCAMP